MLSCLNCKNCKIDMKNAILRCKKGRWTTGFGKEMKVVLQKYEIQMIEVNLPNYHTLIRYPSDYIRYRIVFETAEMCQKAGDYESMEE